MIDQIILGLGIPYLLWLADLVKSSQKLGFIHIFPSVQMGYLIILVKASLYDCQHLVFLVLLPG